MDQLPVRQALEESKEVFELWCDVMLQDAQRMKVRYDQLVDEGFSQDQALEIIKSRGTQI